MLRTPGGVASDVLQWLSHKTDPGYFEGVSGDSTKTSVEMCDLNCGTAPSLTPPTTFYLHVHLLYALLPRLWYCSDGMLGARLTCYNYGSSFLQVYGCRCDHKIASVSVIHTCAALIWGQIQWCSLFMVLNVWRMIPPPWMCSMLKCALLMAPTGYCNIIDLFFLGGGGGGGEGQPVLIINNQSMEGPVVGKKCIRPYAADHITAMKVAVSIQLLPG